MFNIANIFKPSKQQSALTKDQIAELLKTTPEALATFESAYLKQAEETTSDNFFDVNAKEAAANLTRTASVCPDEVIERIVNELLVNTSAFVYKDGKVSCVSFSFPPIPPITPAELQAVAADDMPKLTGGYCMRDMPGSSEAVLFYYQRFLNAKDEKKKKFYYDHFRQGLDILDLDPLLYEIIGTNQNSMGYWLPPLLEGIQKQEFFKVPDTTVIKVPLPLLQLTRLPYEEMNPSTIKILDQFCMKAFNLDVHKDYFIKTGTYSSKYNFRNARVTGEKEVRELGEYLLFIHYQALMMASPLATPTIYGVSTTNEWVVREFIPDKSNRPCIYTGMPLRTEYRVFVDFDAGTILGINPYWDPDVMKNRFGNGSDANTPDKLHDYVIYKAYEETLMAEYRRNKSLVREKIESMLGEIPLSGQWSIDIMQDNDDFYIIDMALAYNSALSECVPAGLLKSPWKIGFPRFRSRKRNKISSGCLKK